MQTERSQLQEESREEEVLQDSNILQAVYEDEIYLYLRHHRHHLQHQFRMLQQNPVQCNGLRCTPDQK